MIREGLNKLLLSGSEGCSQRWIKGFIKPRSDPGGHGFPSAAPPTG